MKALAEQLHGLGCKVKVCLATHLNGITDIADWLDVGKAYAAKVLSEHLQSYEPPEPASILPQDENESKVSQDEIRDNSALPAAGAGKVCTLYSG